jgi:hypothetical protein
MSEAVRAAVFGNVGTMIVFRVGSFDAQIFEKEFAPQFTADDIVNLGQYQMSNPKPTPAVSNHGRCLENSFSGSQITNSFDSGTQIVSSGSSPCHLEGRLKSKSHFYCKAIFVKQAVLVPNYCC